MVSIAVRKDGKWTIISATLREGTSTIWFRCEELNLDALAFPIDPRMKREDIDGSTRIFPNDANDGWMFAHATAGHHHVFEHHLEGAIVGRFAHEESALIGNVFTALAGDNVHVKTSSRLAYDRFKAFRSAVLGAALKIVSKWHIGRHIQQPDDSHLHDIMKQAMDATIADWKANRDPDWVVIRPEAERVAASLTSRTVYEPRWVHDERDRPKVLSPMPSLTAVAPSDHSRQLDLYFTDDDPLTYTAMSSDEAVATVSITGGQLIVSVKQAGTATITVRGTDPGNRVVEQTFDVTAIASE